MRTLPELAIGPTEAAAGAVASPETPAARPRDRGSGDPDGAAFPGHVPQAVRHDAPGEREREREREKIIIIIIIIIIRHHSDKRTYYHLTILGKRLVMAQITMHGHTMVV